MSKNGISLKVFYFLNRVLPTVKVFALTCHFMVFSYAKVKYEKIYSFLPVFSQIYTDFSFPKNS